MSKPIELIHRPLGDRHPYEQSADERVPRHPNPDQPVEIRLLTRPIAQVQQAHIVYWNTNNPDQKTSKPATFLESVGTEIAYTEDGHLSEAAARAGLVVGVDRWRVDLPSFPAGTQIQYQLTIAGQGESVTSQTYTYTVRQAVSLNEISQIYRSEDALIFELHNSAENKNGTLHLRWSDSGHVKLSVGVGNCPHIEECEPIQIQPDDSQRLQLDDVTVLVRPNESGFALQLSHGNSVIMSDIALPQLIIGAQGTVDSVHLSFASPPNERFYGFGERFNALDQRGNRLDIRVYEQYKNHGQRTYLPVPLMVSSQGYGVLVQSLRLSTFDLAHENPERWALTTELGKESKLSLDIVLGAQTHLLDVVSRLNALTGRPVLPPSWAFGLWMSGNEWNSQARVEEMISKHEEHGLPATVIVLEAWSDENTFYIWNDAEYTPKAGGDSFGYEDFHFPPDGLWPDPKGMIEQLHQKGVRVLLWQIPVLKLNEDEHAQLANDKEHMVAQGYCVRHEDGSPYEIRPFWFQNGLLMDFTHAQGTAWWMQKRAYLLAELGIDGFKTDGGEHIWGRDLLLADGRKSDEVWNEYPNLYAGAYFNYARTHKPDAITFSRAGYSGAQAFPCHWAGDENSTWEAFRHSIFAGLNAGISGIPFWGWDFAGFSGDIPTAELYLRATAMATFCPIMQYHSEYNHHRHPSNDRTPWNIQARTGNEQVISTFRFFANLRLNLIPYITSEAWHASQTGVPLMRALPLAFPTDAACRQYPYHYLFGSALLIAPVVEEGATEWPVYLPAGEWYDFWTGERFAGKQHLRYDVADRQIPVFVRAGSILPLNLGDTFSLGSDVGNSVERYANLCFRVYPGKRGSYQWFGAVGQETYLLRFEQGKPFEFDVPYAGVTVQLPNGETAVF